MVRECHGRDQNSETQQLGQMLLTLLATEKSVSSVEAVAMLRVFHLAFPKGEMERAKGRVFDLPVSQLWLPGDTVHLSVAWMPGLAQHGMLMVP